MLLQTHASASAVIVVIPGIAERQLLASIQN